MIAVNMERKVLGVFALMFAGLLATAALAYITTHRLVNTAEIGRASCRERV